MYPVDPAQGLVDRVHWEVRMLTTRSILYAVCPVNLLAWSVDYVQTEDCRQAPGR